MELWALLNKRWRPVSVDEIRKMAICDLEKVIAAAGFTEDEHNRWLKPVYGAFEVH